MWEKEDRKATQHKVEGTCIKHQVFRVHLDDGCIQQASLLDLSPRFSEHLFGQVDARDLAVRSNFFCCRKKIRASAYAHIQYPGPLVNTDALNQTPSGISEGVWSYATIYAGDA